MTRATLLQLLAHPTALTGADVHALEQLAEAFPYCQTAHLLLAKAAHDQGSMLAGQRLRRAATYAADRARLRELIELVPAAAPVPALAEVVEAASAPPTPLAKTEHPAAASPPAELLPEPAIAPAPDSSSPAESSLSEASDNQGNDLLVDLPEQVILPAQLLAVTDELVEDELPAQAPPIRPPAEAAAAHTEFGLAPHHSPTELMAYQLPGLTETEELALAPTPLLPPFNGLAGIGYAPGEGSRLGFCLVATADEPTAAGLPPAGEFFAPDALLLAHLSAHQPRPSSLSLIDSFLRRAPAASRRRTALPLPDTGDQADLSVRSTQAVPDLASESLAKILVRQGKIDRAIAIYERLMVKHPEKMAYFAAQLESLRPSA